MKKLFSVVAAAVLVLALAGCTSSAASGSSSASESSSAAGESSSASDAASSSSASSQSTSAVKWTDADTAGDAAKGAGFDTFDVMDEVKIDDLTFKDPSFSYADGVAQALYETGAAGLFVRKADGKHTAPLTDRDKTEFAQTWSKSYDGLDVTMYGAAKGAATVITWTDGTQEFGVTYQGLGGEELSMDSDEVASIVKGLKKANAKEQSKQAESADDDDDKDSQSADPSEGKLSISEADAVSAAEDASGGMAENAYADYVDGHGWVWVVTTNDENGNKNTYYVDNYGNPYNAEFDSNSSTELTLSEGDAVAIAEQESGGKATNSYPEQTESHGLCWHVSTKDENGNVNEYHVDNDGNAFNIEFE